MYFFRPPSYEELMQHSLSERTTENRQICSIHDTKLDRYNPTSVQSNVACNCHLSSRNLSNSNDNASTAIQIDPLESSSSFPARISRALKRNNGPKELPLIDGVKNLETDEGPQSSGSIVIDGSEKDIIDDDTEPPPCYSELFEKPLTPSNPKIT